MSLTTRLKSIFKKTEQVAESTAKRAVKVADVNKDGKVNTKDAKAAGAKVAKTASKATNTAKKKVTPKKK